MTKEEANKEMAEYNEMTFMEAIRNINPEESKKSLRKAEKKVRMILRGTYQNNPEYKKDYSNQGKIDVIVGYRKIGRKRKVPVLFSQLSEKEKEDYKEWVKEQRKKKVEEKKK
jgi:hypothetical protein